MSNEVLVATVVVVRVLFLALFSGAYIWFTTAFAAGAELLPPPQRLELTDRVLKRFLAVSWVFVIAMSAGGLASAFLVGSQNLSTVASLGDLSSLLYTPQGVILALEAIVTLLIVVCSATIQFVYLPRARESPISITESGDKSLKWLTAKDSGRGLKAISSISWLSIANIILGVFAIALGVIYSSL